MPTVLGAHNPRVDFARELLTKKGRREHGRFAFEGSTLLQEALDAGIAVESIYATQRAFESIAPVRDLERGGIPVYLVDDRTMQRISDVETPAGVLAVAPLRLEPAKALLEEPGLVLALADLSDPGNAGTLLRSAEAFGVDRVILGDLGAEPYLPKVVRGAMGALFRLRLAVSAPGALGDLPGWEVTGLSAAGSPLAALEWPQRSLLVVGNERRGLDRWEPLCTRFGALPMSGHAESLNAAVAGSIALYEATKR